MATKFDHKVEELKKNLGLDADTQAELRGIELDVTTSYTLADAIREGCTVSTKVENWGDGETACALTAAALSAKARGYV